MNPRHQSSEAAEAPHWDTWGTSEPKDPWAKDMWDHLHDEWTKDAKAAEEELEPPMPEQDMSLRDQAGNSDDEDMKAFMRKQAEELKNFKRIHDAKKLKRETSQQPDQHPCAEACTSVQGGKPPKRPRKWSRPRGERRGTRHEWFKGLYKAKRGGEMAEAAYIMANPKPPPAPKENGKGKMSKGKGQDKGLKRKGTD